MEFAVRNKGKETEIMMEVNGLEKEEIMSILATGIYGAIKKLSGNINSNLEVFLNMLVILNSKDEEAEEPKTLEEKLQ